MLADGRIQEAMALQAAVAHNIWCAARASSDPTLHFCPRCGHAAETMFYRLWVCPDNDLCSHLDVISTQELRDQAAPGCDHNAAFWLGCLIIGYMGTCRKWFNYSGTSCARGKIGVFRE